MTKRIVFVVVFVCAITSTIAQIKTAGLPYIKGYDKLQYSAGTQSWDIDQDTNGLMYFANNDALLQFDGENWRTYPISNHSVVRNVHVSEEGRIYAAGFNEFGYYDADNRGELQYHSLRDKLPPKHQNVGEVWRIHETSQGIIFQSFSHLMLYSDGNIQILATSGDFGFSFYVDNRFFIQDKEEGLKELRGNRLFILADGNSFINENEVWSILEYGQGKLLIGTQQHGLFIYDGYSISRFKSEASDILTEKQIFSSCRIDEGLFAYGTIQDGMYVMNKKGEIVQHLNKGKGLLNNTVLDIFQDQNHQLWLALDNGINYVEIFSPFTFIQAGMGIEGAGYDAALFEENLYLATNQGLFKKYYKNNTTETFRLLPKIKGQVWSLRVVDKDILVAHNRGAYTMRNNKVNHLHDGEGIWRFLELKGRDNLLMAGTYSGLMIFDKENGTWKKRNMISGFEESCRVLEQDEDGNIWVSHGYKGIYRVSIDDEFEKATNVAFYNSNAGLPSDFDNYVYKLNGEVVFGTSEGIYLFDKNSEQFRPYPKWQQRFSEGNNIRFPKQDSQGNIWYGVEEHPRKLQKTQESYSRHDTIFSRLGDCLVGGFENIVPLDNQNTLICSESGFIHFNPKFKYPHYQPVKTLIREVISTGKTDSVIYRGHHQENEASHEFHFGMNDLLIKMSATIYGRRGSIKYQTYLEGYDNGWSEVLAKNIKEYTNLPPGSYVFRVKAQDEQNQQITEDEYAFRILPPWYRSIVAHILYVLLSMAAIWMATRYISRRMKEEKEKLRKKQIDELQKKDEKFRQEALMAEQKIIKLKNEKLRAEVEKKRADMELKNKEVVGIAMQMTHKNEILSEIKRKLTAVAQKVNEQAQGEIKNLVRTIDSDVRMDNDWGRFQKHFEDVHSDFFRSLKSMYPDLTPKDLRMCAYLRMNLSTKEIALISNISVRGVEISRYRLRKKLDLDKDQNLVDFMMNL